MAMSKGINLEADFKNLSINKTKKHIIYVVGGISGGNIDLMHVPNKIGWSYLTSCKRSYCNAVVVRKVLYIVGGRNEASVPLNTVLRYKNNDWETLPLKLMFDRSECGSVVMNDIIYITGGFDKSQREIEVYDPVNNIQKKGPLLQRGRWGHCAVLVDDKIYVVGGHAFHNYFHQVESWSPADDSKWSSCAGMNRRRAYFGAAVVGPYVYVFGGCGGVLNNTDIDRLCSAERYDTRSDTWTLIADLPSARSNLSAVSWNDDTILLTGGIDDRKQKLRDVLLYNCNTDTYSRYTVNLNKWRFSHSTVTV